MKMESAESHWLGIDLREGCWEERSLLLATTNCVCDELRTPRSTMAPEAKVGELAAAARAGRASARMSFMVE